MHRALARFNVSRPPAPQHVGAPLRVGELVLLRRENSWFDFKVELRAIDDDLAAVRIIDKLERVPLSCLGRAETLH